MSTVNPFLSGCMRSAFRLNGASALVLALLFGSPRLAGAQAGCPGGSGAPIVVTNFKNNETVGYDLLLVKGTVAAGTQEVTLAAGSEATSWPVAGTLFRGFIPVKPGANKVVVSASGNQNACFDVHFAPNKVFGSHRLMIITPNDMTGDLIPTYPGNSTTISSLKRRVQLLARMQESLIADMLRGAGKPRRAPYFERDEKGEISVQIVGLGTRDELEGRGESYLVNSKIYPFLHDQDDGHSRIVAYYPNLAPAYRGGDGAVLFPMARLLALPQDVREITPRFTERRTFKELGMPGSESDPDPFNTLGKNAAVSFGWYFKIFGTLSLGVPNVDSMTYEAYGNRSSQLFRNFMTKTDIGADVIDELLGFSTGTADHLSNLRWVPDPMPPRTPALPASAVPAKTEQGLNYKYYLGQFTRLPDFVGLTPTASGTSEGFALLQRTGEENYAMVFEGFLNIAAAGPYLFSVTSNDGCRLILDGKILVEFDKLTQADQTSRNQTPIALQAGVHSIQVQYFVLKDSTAAAVKPALKVEWYHDAATKLEAIPGPALSRASTSIGVRPVGLAVGRADLHRVGGLAILSLGTERHVWLTLVSPSGRFEGEVFRGVLPAGEHRLPMPHRSESGILRLQVEP